MFFLKAVGAAVKIKQGWEAFRLQEPDKNPRDSVRKFRYFFEQIFGCGPLNLRDSLVRNKKN